jgi:DNA-binding transcriptional LysR family regulator
MEYRTDSVTMAPRLVNRLRLKHWALLAALADTRKLNEAALRISTTQPSATKMLADIEHAFQFAVFERHPRGLRPTALGEEVLGYAQQMQASLTRFLEDLDVKRRGGHGLLIIGAIMGAAPDLLSRAVAEIKRERPLLKVRILGETSDQVGELLEQHDIEFAVGRITSPLQHNLFDFTPLAGEVMQVVVRSGHPLARMRQVDLGSLTSWPWLAQPLTSPARQLLEAELAAHRLATPANIVECASVFATLQLLQNSDAVAMLPESVVRDHVKAKLLRGLPIVVGNQMSGFGILTRKGDTLSEAAASFVEKLLRFANEAGTPEADVRPACQMR